MPRHVIVDGSNLATEGRSMPSLQQLNDAVTAFMAEHPTDLITVVVDATFGHRIDPKEVPEFEAAIEHNELVAPPAGAIGRGDAFVLSIAGKVGATILTNDSYQEFHADYPWLFDEGRLVGGKPVPNVGWVFVNRTPVRGPVSRRATREKRTKTAVGTARVGSKEASQPMPVPKTPPPGAVIPQKQAPARSRSGRGRAPAPAETIAAAAAPAPARAAQAQHVNDLLAFLGFVENHPVGTSVNAIVESYSSHGAYVTIGDVRGYVPLRLMAEPAPRSAREAMAIGESVTLVVVSFAPSRRSIDLAVPHLAVGLVTKPPEGDIDEEGSGATASGPAGRTKKAAAKKAAAKKAPAKKTPATKAVEDEAPAEKAPAKKGPAKKASATKAAGETAPAKKAPAKKTPATKAVEDEAPAEKAPAKKAPAKKAPAKKAPATKAVADEAPAKKAPADKAPAKKAPATKAAADKAPAKKAPAKKAAQESAPAKKAPAKKATAEKMPAKKAAAATPATTRTRAAGRRAKD